MVPSWRNLAFGSAALALGGLLLARRVDANWIAGLVVRGIVDMDDAREMIHDAAYRLAKKAYKFDQV